ncbi:hypothetical protein VTI74DRAFT_9841 [Chaetomium olivicolor]
MSPRTMSPSTGSTNLNRQNEEQPVQPLGLTRKDIAGGRLQGTSPRSISAAFPWLHSQLPAEEHRDCFSHEPTIMPAAAIPDTNLELSSKARSTRDAMARFLDELSPSLGAIPTKNPTVDPWRTSQLSGCNARLSMEWETETLLDHASDNPDVDRVPYSCPFRKRNPARFNIRDHESCARAPLCSVSELLRHVITHHRLKAPRHQCQRCKLDFDDKVALEKHLLLPRDQMCEVAMPPPHDSEDGITDDMLEVLAARYATEQTWSWEALWSLLFPTDVEVPQPEFQPAVELVEIEQSFDEGQEALKLSLREKLRLLLPGVLDNDYLNFLTGQIELVFETHRVNIMKQSSSRHVKRCAELRSGSHIKDQPTATKPNRRSRRNTIIQSIHHIAQDTPKEFSAHKQSRRSSIVHTRIPFSERFPFNSARSQAETAIVPTRLHEQPTAPNTHHSKPLPYPSEYYTDVGNPLNLGIGIPCNWCELESCSCSKGPLPAGTRCKHAGLEHGGHAQAQTLRACAPQHGHSSRRRPQSYHPKLSLTTGGLDVECSGVVQGLRGSVSADGRFSPESFKQRVLRQHIMGR